jgi:hypothetical protein
MKKIEFESPLDSRKKLMTVLFWINRKAARTEGCAPFLIKKIETEDKTYIPEGKKLLKLTDPMMDDIINSIETKNPVKFEIQMGSEYIKAELHEDVFCVKTEHSGEIEEEIVEKLGTELNKKFPSICESFKPRVTPNS